MTATLAEATMQDRGHRMIHRGLVALASDMLFLATPATDVATEFIAAGLMQIYPENGQVLLSMDGINGHGSTIAHAFRNWLAIATCHYADEAQSEGAITAARLQ